MVFCKQVNDMHGFQTTQSRSLEDEVSDRVLEDMRRCHPEAMRLCVNQLRNSKGQIRQYDGIIVANNCVKVVEVRPAGAAALFCYTGISDGGCYPHMSSIHAQTSSRDQCRDVASSPVSLWPGIQHNVA
jgi:hypothetical protein